MVVAFASDPSVLILGWFFLSSCVAVFLSICFGSLFVGSLVNAGCGGDVFVSCLGGFVVASTMLPHVVFILCVACCFRPPPGWGSVCSGCPAFCSPGTWLLLVLL